MLKYGVILTISALTLASLFFFTQNVSADLTPTYNQSLDQEITIGQNSAGSVEIQIYPSNAQEDFTVTFQTVVDNQPLNLEVLPIKSVKINPYQNPFYVYMTVAAGPDTPTGTYLVHVTSKSTLSGHETTRTNTVSVHVVPPDAFFLSALPSSVTIPQGGSSNVHIVTTAKKTLPNEILLLSSVEDMNIVLGGFSGAGELAQYSYGTFWGVHPISGSSLTSSLEISAKPNTPPGTYYVWVSGQTTMSDPNVSSFTNFYRHTILITVNVTPSTTETTSPQNYLIPGWVRNNAKYWSEGQISDSDFASGIGYLVTNGIIQTNTKGVGGLTATVPADMQIPSWIKNDARFWSTGDIDDGSFLKGIQYMLDNDIITFSSHAVVKTNLPTTPTPQVTTSPNDNSPQRIVQLILPQTMVQEATGPTGATVNFDASESSGGTPTCNPASGTIFPIGSTTVKCTAVDSVGSNPVEGSFTVTVQDTTPPVISPFAPHNDTPDDTGAVVYFTISAVDLVDGSVTPHCNYDSGTKFPLGVSTITCTATDSHGNTSTRSLQISITKS